jgi:hypothetical protein
MLAIGNAAVGWAEQTLDTGTPRLIIASVPLWMALLDRVFYGQRLARVGRRRPGRRLRRGRPAGRAGRLHGFSRAAVVLVFSSLAWAIGSLYSRQAPQPQPTPRRGGMQMLAGGLILTVVAAVSGELATCTPGRSRSSPGSGSRISSSPGRCSPSRVHVAASQRADALVGTYAYVNPFVAVCSARSFSASRSAGARSSAAGSSSARLR